MAWQFQREEQSFNTKIPEGKHRIRIKDAEKAISKTGNDMLVLKFDVSGYNATIYHYITFMADRPEITNRMLTQFFDSFKDIAEGDLNMQNWIGKVGACTIKHEEYNGNINAKISSFIAKEKQGDLPAWKEPETGNSAPVPTDANGFMTVDTSAEEFPF